MVQDQDSTRNIIRGPPDTSTIPKKSLGHIYYNELKRKDGERVILINEETSEEFTYAQLLRLSENLARNLKKMGLRKNDVITIISPNNWQFVVAILAGFFAGVKINLLNPDYTIGEIKHFFDLFVPKVVFCTAKTSSNLLKLQEEFSIQHVVSFDAVDGTDDFNEFLKLDEEVGVFEVENVDYDDVAFILTSSGTTGLPKAVGLTHQNMRTSLLYTNGPMFINFNENESTIGYLPFFHVFGSIVALASIFYETKVTILSRFVPDVFLNAIQKSKVTILFTVPPILLFLMKSPLVAKYDIASIKELLCGGAAVSKDLQCEIKSTLGINRVRQVYGLTETAGGVLIAPNKEEKFGSVGKATHTMQLKVCDKHGNILGPNELGELRLKGDNIMKEYVGNPKQTEDAFDENGYLKTGDLCYFDEEGSFYIVDRLKEIIKYKGFQVSPVELENLLLKCPSVKDAAVIGKPDERAGELPVAFIVKQINKDVNEEELLKYVEENVSLQKRLYGGIRFVEEIPKNPSGKILRRKLKELL